MSVELRVVWHILEWSARTRARLGPCGGGSHSGACRWRPMRRAACCSCCCRRRSRCTIAAC